MRGGRGGTKRKTKGGGGGSEARAPENDSPAILRPFRGEKMLLDLSPPAAPVDFLWLSNRTWFLRRASPPLPPRASLSGALFARAGTSVSLFRFLAGAFFAAMGGDGAMLAEASEGQLSVEESGTSVAPKEPDPPRLDDNESTVVGVILERLFEKLRLLSLLKVDPAAQVRVRAPSTHPSFPRVRDVRRARPIGVLLRSARSRRIERRARVPPPPTLPDPFLRHRPSLTLPDPFPSSPSPSPPGRRDVPRDRRGHLARDARAGRARGPLRGARVRARRAQGHEQPRAVPSEQGRARGRRLGPPRDDDPALRGVTREPRREPEHRLRAGGAREASGAAVGDDGGD